MTDQTSYVAARIRKLVTQHGITQVQLARVLGVSRITVHRRLNGHCKFTANEVLLLANHLDLRVGELLDDAA